MKGYFLAFNMTNNLPKMLHRCVYYPSSNEFRFYQYRHLHGDVYERLLNEYESYGFKSMNTYIEIIQTGADTNKDIATIKYILNVLEKEYVEMAFRHKYVKNLKNLYPEYFV